MEFNNKADMVLSIELNPDKWKVSDLKELLGTLKTK